MLFNDMSKVCAYCSKHRWPLDMYWRRNFCTQRCGERFGENAHNVVIPALKLEVKELKLKVKEYERQLSLIRELSEPRRTRAPSSASEPSSERASWGESEPPTQRAPQELSKIPE
jgi:hypothetical protein